MASSAKRPAPRCDAATGLNWKLSLKTFAPKNIGSRQGCKRRLTGLRMSEANLTPFPRRSQGALPAPTNTPIQVEVVSQDTVARDFAQRYRDRLLFDHDAGAWFLWTGTHWRRDTTKLAFDHARRLARDIAEALNTKTQLEMGRVAFAEGVEKFARADRVFAMRAEAWDRDPLLLGTPNGTVDLRSGVLRLGAPDDRISKITAVAPADDANCPIWMRFIEETTACDTAIARFLQVWSGYCLTGETREHALVFVYGDGGHGKSVFVNTISGVAGDYAITAPMDTLIEARGDRHPTDLAMLAGARLVTASETEQGRAWAEARIKSMTGGDRIRARFMRQIFSSIGRRSS
jgi:putative DNA primase/helicase